MADAVEILHSKINPQICGNRHQNHHLFHHRRISNVSPIRSSKYGGVSSSSVGRGYPSPKPNSQFGPERSSPFSSAGTEFHGEKRGNLMVASATQMKAGLIGKAAQKWWEKGSELSNMKEVNGAQDLVDSLLNAGDKLVVVDFFSPGCGGCKALHPKICQFAEMNPNVEFLQVNYEEHKSMCYSLNVHVLPFFRFYRGAHGRLCSFSCTNATIKKFKDALARHSPDRCSLGPPRGLEEKELLALSSNSDLSFTYIPPKPVLQPVYPSSGDNERSEEPATTSLSSSNPLSTAFPSTQGSEEKDLVFAGR